MSVAAGRQQEYAQARRHAFAQQRDGGEGKSDVGGRGNGPAPQRRRIAAIDRHIDQRRHQHAPDGGDGRKRRLAPARQLPLDHLALDLAADDQEEQRHQPVVDPEQQRLVDVQRPQANLEWSGKEKIVIAGKPAVVGDQRQQCCEKNEHPRSRFEPHEFADFIDQPFVVGLKHALPLLLQYRKCSRGAMRERT